MKNIVALVDFSDITSRILDFAATLGKALGSHVTLLHVVPLEPVIATLGAEAPILPEPLDQERLEADKRQLQSCMDVLTNQGVKASALQFEGRVVETVLDQTGKMDADLVIMGSHHHNALYNFFVGSVAADLLKRLPFPVLVVPADVPEKILDRTTQPALSAEDMRQNSTVMQPVLSA